jgi:Kinesin motor domain
VGDSNFGTNVMGLT